MSEVAQADPPRVRIGALPITVFCGFLGAGKTTLLKRLLRDSGALRYAVIVNDLSELAVDAALVEEARHGRGEKIVALNRGSLGGALLGELQAALSAMEGDTSVDYLLIETSGGTHPDALIAELQSRTGSRLDTFATVVDGLNLVRDYDQGRALLGADVPASTSPLGLLHAQIAAASVLLISKADLLTRPQAEEVLRSLRRINASAFMQTIAYGAVSADVITNTGSVTKRNTAARQASTAPTAPRHDDPSSFDIGSVVLFEKRPFHPQRLYELFTQRLPMGVHRTKGWLWLASRPLDVFLFNQAGSYFALEWVATWKAGALADPDARLLPEERQALAARLATTDPVFGDRHCELTVIGSASDRSIFFRELQRCLCTVAEVAEWKRGVVFDDPWPRTVRKV